MLFFEYSFLFLFFPFCFAGYLYILRYKASFIAGWLALNSVIFYSIWDYSNLLPLFASIFSNYFLGYRIAQASTKKRKKAIFIPAILLNLTLLGYYKYSNFLGSFFDPEAFLSENVSTVAIPLGISFFTFTQIAFLADTYKEKCREYNLVNYILFVTYFPHLIAGPIIHHKEMMPQFKTLAKQAFQWENLSLGVSLFMIGLFKKVIVADYFVSGIQSIFSQSSGEVSFINAWFGTLSYTMQIYFDFSGYSDMALGLSKVFGIKLPVNFNSPYQATSIVDFWRRWHITLSRFLRDYIYIPLGGNRHGEPRKYMNLFLTMFIGGLWHGAGWTFIIWGSLHGILLILNNLLIRFFSLLPFSFPKGRLVLEVKKIFTFLIVALLWVPFRAQDLKGTLNIWKGCLGFNGFAFPEVWGQKMGALSSIVTKIGFTFEQIVPAFSLYSAPFLFIALLVALYAPNSIQIFGPYKKDIALFESYTDIPNSKIGFLTWKPTKRCAAVMVILSIFALWCRYEVTEFLYFQF